MEVKEGSKRHKASYGSIPRSGERRALFISLALLIAVMIMLILEYVPRAGRFEAGKPSSETVISAREFSVIDEESTEKAREAERERIKNLFINKGAQAAAVSSLEDFFRQASIISTQSESLEKKVEQLKPYSPPVINVQTMETVLTSSDEYERILYVTAVELLTMAMSNPVSNDNLEEVHKKIFAKAEEFHLEETTRELASSLAVAFTTLNTDYPSETILRNMDAAASYIKPVSFSFSVGQKIVEKGELISPFILSALDKAGALSPVGTYQQVLGISLLLAALYAGALLFFKRFRPKIAADWRVVAMICLVFLVFCLLCRLFSVFADENLIWGYLIPLALVGLTLTVFLDNLVAMFMVVLGGIITGLIVKGNFYLTITAIIGGMAGVILVTHLRHREHLVRVGVELSLVLAGFSMITASIIKDFHFVLIAGAMGLANGALATLLTLGLLPILEKISGITTPMRLLELASPDHPLMVELITKAPGTYSHSVIVGNLAAAAAREIGADALMARIGSYYHDIGKTKRSTFFVENQPRGFNGHEKIKPNLSALVIAAHVREGVDMAREYRLPEEITDIIQQHHGTSLIRYFYARALQEGDRTSKVSENRFRYPGEKPQTKEAAIVMLADAIEAAAKAQVKPDPVKLDQLARSLVKEKLDDGQLSESQLTLEDLDRITKAFVHILAAMYHERVAYPALVKGEGMS
jgi:putative nucleotidyltransferase with HDIG domain